MIDFLRCGVSSCVSGSIQEYSTSCLVKNSLIIAGMVLIVAFMLFDSFGRRYSKRCFDMPEQKFCVKGKRKDVWWNNKYKFCLTVIIVAIGLWIIMKRWWKGSY